MPHFCFSKIIFKSSLCVDLEKAYDTMNRTELWNSLHDYGAEAWLLHVMEVKQA